MQNIDLYTGTAQTDRTPFSSYEPEFLYGLHNRETNEQDRISKKASRIIFVIAALCITSFTTGLIVGIKFVGGEKTQIVDDTTYEAMGQLKAKVSDLMAGEAKTESGKDQFPTAEFPYMIRIGTEYAQNTAKDVAAYLSSMGHRVILSKGKADYRIYTGPYKDLASAEKAMKKLETYQRYSIANNGHIIRRKASL